MYWGGSWGSPRRPSCARARPTARQKAPLRTPGAMPPPSTARRGRPATLTPARTQLSQAGRKLASTLHGK